MSQSFDPLSTGKHSQRGPSESHCAHMSRPISSSMLHAASCALSISLGPLVAVRAAQVAREVVLQVELAHDALQLVDLGPPVHRP